MGNQTTRGETKHKDDLTERSRAGSKEADMLQPKLNKTNNEETEIIQDRISLFGLEQEINRSSRTSDLEQESDCDEFDESSDFSFDELLEERNCTPSATPAASVRSPSPKKEKLSIGGAEIPDDAALVADSPRRLALNSGMSSFGETLESYTIPKRSMEIPDFPVVSTIRKRSMESTADQAPRKRSMEITADRAPRKRSMDESAAQTRDSSSTQEIFEQERRKKSLKPGESYSRTNSGISSDIDSVDKHKPKTRRRRKKINVKERLSISKTKSKKWKPYKPPAKKKKSNYSDRPQFTKSGVRRKLGPRDIGRAENFKRAKYDLNLDYDPMAPRGLPKINWAAHAERQLGPKDIGRAKYGVARFDYEKNSERRGYASPDPVERALGPVDIGRKVSYDVAEYDLESKPSKVYKQVKVERKLGPVDIGRAEDYEVAHYESPERDFDILPPVERKLGPVDIGRLKDYEVGEYELPDTGSFLSPRIAHMSLSGHAEHKLGPTDIGRLKDYEVAHYEEPERKIEIMEKAEHKLGPTDIGRLIDYEVGEYELQDPGSFLAERIAHMSLSGHAEHKLGPTEIGRLTDYEVAHYEELEKKAVIMEKAERKLGPTDIGRLTGYDVAEYDIQRESGIFKDRIAHVPEITEHLPRKQGPLDIGFKESFEQPHYDLSDSDGDFLRERIPHVGPITVQVPRKLGPLDMGIKESFEPARYDISDDSSDFLGERLPHVSPITEKVPRKLGPVDMGIKDSFDPADYGDAGQKGLHDGVDWVERVPHVRPISHDERVRKQGPLEIGLKESFDPADYGDAGTKGLHDGRKWVERVPHVDLEGYEVERKEGPQDAEKPIHFVKCLHYEHVSPYKPYRIEE